MKTCAKCRALLPVDQFSKNQGTSDGLRDYCRTCAAARIADYHRRNPDQQAAQDARNNPRKDARRGGYFPLDPTTITPQPTSCDLCHRPTANLVRDHQHDKATRNFRGWLCHDCNLGLGRLGDNLVGIQNAQYYLLAYLFRGWKNDSIERTDPK